MTDDPLGDDVPDWLTGGPWHRDLRELLQRMDRQVDAVVVEGPNDEAALRRVGVETPIHTCSQTNGLAGFASSLPGEQIAILTDYDDPGQRLNAKLRAYIPDARVDPRWRRELGLLLTQRGRYDIESLNNVFSHNGRARERKR